MDHLRPLAKYTSIAQYIIFRCVRMTFSGECEKVRAPICRAMRNVLADAAAATALRLSFITGA